MDRKLKLLVITPYEEMKETALAVGQNYRDIDLTVLVGNQSIGRRLAQERYSANYDCIISRGDTASMIRAAVATPVIDIKVSLYDMLASLEDLKEIPERVAAVGYHSFVDGMDVLARFFPIGLEIHSFSSLEETDAIFTQLEEKGIHILICDTITYEIATARGFQACILRSSESSFRYAYEQARQLHQTNLLMLEENQLLRRLFSANGESETAVFTEAGQLCYSTLDEKDLPILEHLEARLPDFAVRNTFRMAKQTEDFFYRISARKIATTSAVYHAFFLSRRVPNLNYRHKSIHYYTEAEIRNSYCRSVFCTTNLQEVYAEEVSRVVKRKYPVLIYGDIGVGKTQLAEIIYLKSELCKSPFVTIDCSLVSRETWHYLIHKNDSPLCDIGHTLFIKNLDALDEGQLKELLALLIDSDIIWRNRLLISFSTSKRPDMGNNGLMHEVINRLNCLSIGMASLRGHYDVIEASVLLLLEDFRKKRHAQLGSITEDAMSMLLHFAWPWNYTQMDRVIRKAATVAGDGDITGEIVSSVLSTELSIAQGETMRSGIALLDMSKSLKDMERDIVRIVLEQHGGNQSNAAKSLGISRTTLWRILKEP